MKFDTLIQVQTYILRHVELFGHPPDAVGVTLDEWKALNREFNTMRRFTHDTQGDEGVITLYVDRTLIVFNERKMRE